MIGFHDQPRHHAQDLKRHDIDARPAFCRKMLENPTWLPKIHFSDESRFILWDDRR
jgi:hypothetical protein